MLTIRDAESNDLDEITNIYNWAILNTTATFDNIPKSIDEQKSWFNDHGNKNPIIIAELDENYGGYPCCGFIDPNEFKGYIANSIICGLWKI